MAWFESSGRFESEVLRIFNKPFHPLIGSVDDGFLTVDSEYLLPTDRVLVVDDFLSTGTTAVALLDIIRQAGATCVGFAFLIEKTFEGGRQTLVSSFKQEDHSIPIETLANITALDDDGSIR